MARLPGYTDGSLMGWESSVPALHCDRCGAVVRRGRGNGAGRDTDLHDAFHAELDAALATLAALAVAP